MSFIDDIIGDLNKCEDYRRMVYDDATSLTLIKGITIKGDPTIGLGRSLTSKGISRSEAVFLATNDVNDILSSCNNALVYFGALSEIRQRVIVNMIYNLGMTGFLEFNLLSAALKQQDYDAAGAAIMNSLAAKQAPRRYAWLTKMMITNAEANM